MAQVHQVKGVALCSTTSSTVDDIFHFAMHCQKKAARMFTKPCNQSRETENPIWRAQTAFHRHKTERTT